MSTKRPIAWSEILLANGLISLLLGLGALFLVRAHFGEAYDWVRQSPPERVRGVVELLVQVYVLYALVMLLLGLVGVVRAARRKRAVPPTPPAVVDAAESGATGERPQP